MHVPLTLGLFLAAVSGLCAAPPPRIEIQSLASSPLVLNAHDRANGTWIMEYSTDGRQWSSMGTEVHVRNSVLPLNPGTGNAPPQGRGFYRLVSVDQTPTKTVSHMLNLPATVHPYAEQSVPPSSLARTVGPATINNNRATLGRVLFYDRRLSLDNSVSCGSCHRQDRAFAEDADFSLGHVGVKTTRNTVSLTHIRNYTKGGGIFWDGRRTVLEDAVIDPVLHPDEMGLSIESLVEKTSTEPYYQSLFMTAFGTNEVTKDRIATALADFVEAMTTFGSRYDQGTINGFASFTAQEIAGRGHFGSRCASCHPMGNFTTGGFANNGLEMNYVDRGRAALTGLPQHEGQFRIPSLRQVALTAPFMHDGRFATLREVIDFYDHGVVAHPNLTIPLTATPMNLSEEQKNALEAFLKTLTDSSIQIRPEFSDPFRTN
jgi:cytochrome c peroxidase